MWCWIILPERTRMARTADREAKELSAGCISPIPFTSTVQDLHKACVGDTCAREPEKATVRHSRPDRKCLGHSVWNPIMITKPRISC